MTPELEKVYNQREVTFPRENNPLWPLPSDYPSLSERWQRVARLNAVCNHSTPDNMVGAWAFFRSYYLKQLPPGVFYKRFKKSPKLHYDLIRDLATYPYNAWAAPRASAKSTVLGKEVPIWMSLTKPHYAILMILAKEPFIVKRFGSYMEMFESNPFVTADFGEMKPKRGSKTWSHHLLQLANGSNITGLPVEGKMLGERPDLILPDDPEHDKSLVMNTNPAALLEAFERLLFGVLFPMLEMGASIGWIGTLLSNRSFLYHVTQSNDPRFKFWNKRVVPIVTETGELAWEDKWTPEVIEALREKLGESEFQAQYMNRPGCGRERLLKIHPDFGNYWVREEDAEFKQAPFKSAAVLVANRPERTPEDGQFLVKRVERSYAAAVASMFRVMTIDYGYTVKSTSDYSCVHVMGVENSEFFKDTIWSLDMWLGRIPLGQLLSVIWDMAIRWRVHVIAPEAVAVQAAMADQIVGSLDIIEQAQGWRPAVMPITYKVKKDKGSRISGALEWRFNQFRVKLPGDRRNTWPYRELYNQITDFTQDLALLPKDDAIDTLAMIQEVVRPGGNSWRQEAGEAPIIPVEELKKGNLSDATGTLYISGMLRDEIPVHDLYMRHLDRLEEEAEVERAKGAVNWVAG